MSISVVIPTYNSSQLIEKTIDSVLRQTVLPLEIIVLDDGSTDQTVSLLHSRYNDRITIVQQKNSGVAAARNKLSKLARAELVAFLDHDDIWHPRYLETVMRIHETHGNAAAIFTHNVNFFGSENYAWADDSQAPADEFEVIPPRKFIDRYNASTGAFYSMSFCVVPKAVLAAMGDKPFCESVSGVDDCYFANLLPFSGPIVYILTPLVAYRITSHAQSSNHLKNSQLVVKVFSILEPRYLASQDSSLIGAFRSAHAMKKRHYAKMLMGANFTKDARTQFIESVSISAKPISFLKSLGLYFSTYLPKRFQPTWPASRRPSAPR